MVFDRFRQVDIPNQDVFQKNSSVFEFLFYLLRNTRLKLITLGGIQRHCVIINGIVADARAGNGTNDLLNVSRANLAVNFGCFRGNNTVENR